MLSTPRAMTLVVLALLLLGLLAEPALAQSCGACAGPSVGSGATPRGNWLREGDGVVRLSDEYEVKDVSYRGHDRVENDFEESLFVNRVALDVRYGVTDDWSAALQFTYPRFYYRLKPPGGQRQKFRFRGPGDTSLLFGRQFLLGAAQEMPPSAALLDDDVLGSVAAPPPYEEHEPDRRPAISAWFGLSLPTGETEEPNPTFVLRDVSVSNLQVGTGTYDPIARVRLDVPAGRGGLFAEVAARVPLHENEHDYRTADTETIAVGGFREILSGVTAVLAVSWQRVGRDEFRGSNVGVGGGRFVHVTPGIVVQLSDSVALDFSARVPVWRSTQTKLSDSKVVWQVGLSYRF